MIVPSESDEPDALKETVKGATPEVGLAVKLAIGDWLEITGAVTVIAFVVESVAPSLSVIVSPTL